MNYYKITQEYFDLYESILISLGLEVDDIVYIEDETNLLKKAEGVAFRPPPTDPPPLNPPTGPNG